jgi:hypothetical protein
MSERAAAVGWFPSLVFTVPSVLIHSSTKSTADSIYIVMLEHSECILYYRSDNIDKHGTKFEVYSLLCASISFLLTQVSLHNNNNMPIQLFYF